MPRDKSENHEKIIEAAFDEFIKYGFEDASMRRIAAASNMSPSGLYKHFPSKEEMFSSLVKPAVDGLMNLYHEIEKEYFDDLFDMGKADISNSKNGVVRTMEYIYDHLQEFELIICKSKGSVYENFKHDIASLEEKVTLQYIEEIKKRGIFVKEFNIKEFHLLVTSYIEALFQTVIHGFSKEEAIHFAKTVSLFYAPAWSAYFGL
ncbi:DNA-binding transcriptional regulator, AcrR family [Acetitomaculum ruminis DSM 5522]|uniref:DNA-binding transcriptional regulator, AcrR family n=1 Tax=Acetitomaculum ruminis DSM 5522 TaxID=1120918 RepID=A0A1I1A2J5_9FIRM|nr:TetR/AcrR family transcriptional regulator [Acetitomaculum ruminis]SFB32087.1 DNA-binding transcriptional regulator, AcrR family [Acetitomaculum ruminis DSM 5522]